MSKLALIAIGGNSISDSKNGISVKFEILQTTIFHVVNVMEMGYEIILTHGNGPQVGLVLNRSDKTKDILPPISVDFATAYTQGEIGYALQMTFENELKKRNIKKGVATLITKVLVDKDDRAFKEPTKPIGTFYSEDEMKVVCKRFGWIMKEDAGRGYRKVVPSPMPRKILELLSIKALIEKGIIVIASGGGGIPVIEQDGKYKGVEGVIDKDYSSSLLAKGVSADVFIISTPTPKVFLNFGEENEKAIDCMSVIEAERWLKEGHFKEGSMAPKIRAAIGFTKETGKDTIITIPREIDDSLKGISGTRILKGK
ncbi:carbamate kinase [candidate division WOR-3 bacterium]|nr:carbamate kinase [candidate division WOR-3 bacterium]